MELAKAGSLYDVGLEKIGLAILSEHLRTAALVFAQSNTLSYANTFHQHERHQRIQDSVAFVKGTGLHVVIEQFHLNLDPEQLKDTFFSWASHRRAVHALPSSSATIVAETSLHAA